MTMGRTPRALVILGLLAAAGAAVTAGAPAELRAPALPGAAQLERQAAEYRAERPKTILELQPLRSTTTVPVRAADGRTGTATLVNLNPYANAWYLLTLEFGATGQGLNYHLENPRPREIALTLLAGDPTSLRVAIGERGTPCTLWTSRPAAPLDEASRTGLPYAPLCDGRLYLRNPVAGRRTSLERVADFLRDHVWGGEQLVGFVKDRVYRDAFLEKPVTHEAGAAATRAAMPQAPQPAAIAPDRAGLAIVPEQLGLDLAAPGRELLVGQWYPVRDLAGVYVSAVTPGTLEPSLLRPGRGVNALGPVELDALVYLVAFDLARFDLHFVLGTDHPRVGWSDRVLPTVRDPALPGPDGIDRPAPLVVNGMVSPAEAARTVAAFTGGFKRDHGAFRYGALAQVNHGSHYGFVEQGVVFSKLQPGLATVLALDDGRVELETWTAAGNSRRSGIRYARQNGVPLVEFDPALGRGVPGALVSNWGAGNWSGSDKGDLRSLRAGVCLQSNDARRFLIYGYFSDATPSAMARVFEAYGCQYALHLDMNALEHTYLALYVTRGKERLVEHLIQGMDVLDQGSGTNYAPRFIGFPDNRDFFYLTRREAPP